MLQCARMAPVLITFWWQRPMLSSICLEICQSQTEPMAYGEPYQWLWPIWHHSGGLDAGRSKPYEPITGQPLNGSSGKAEADHSALGGSPRATAQGPHPYTSRAAGPPDDEAHSEPQPRPQAAVHQVCCCTLRVLKPARST